MNKVSTTIISIIILTSALVRADLKYPYQATEERSSLIMSQFLKINIGNTTNEVLSILPAPDQIHDLYEPKMYKPKIIGSTYWYIIQRKVASGSVKEKDEKLVRISFDLSGNVTKVDKWGF